MVLPILPISPRTDVSIDSQFNPNLYQFQSGVAKRTSRDYRKAVKGAVNFSTYLDDILTVTNFLHSRSGYLPFTFLQDGKNYICSKWTCTYTTGNKGTIQMELIRYNNPV